MLLDEVARHLADGAGSDASGFFGAALITALGTVLVAVVTVMGPPLARKLFGTTKETHPVPPPTPTPAPAPPNQGDPKWPTDLQAMADLVTRAQLQADATTAENVQLHAAMGLLREFIVRQGYSPDSVIQGRPERLPSTTGGTT